MTKSWALSDKLIIRVLSPNRYDFQFFNWRDKEKVLTGRPWCFDNILLVLKEIEGNEQPEQISLFHSPFWVRIKHLPFNCRTDEDVKEIVMNLVDLMEIEEDALGLDRFRRVRVMINITKPLRRFQRIRDKQGKEIIVEFAYERLPFFFNVCGVIGHSERDCVMIFEESKKLKLGWGRWHRASPRKGRMKDLEELEAVLGARKKLFITRDDDGLKGSGEVVAKKGDLDTNLKELSSSEESEELLSAGEVREQAQIGVRQGVEGGMLLEGVSTCEGNAEGSSIGGEGKSTIIFVAGEGGKATKLSGKKWKKGLKEKGGGGGNSMDIDRDKNLGKRHREVDDELVNSETVAKKVMTEVTSIGWRRAETVDEHSCQAQ
ncbi:uncharacterized protein LOC110738541 [Chenopodium quinoa]|uniref:uncharacterized protein LOC110738541 n=1 Tax=Chenopodium quinoa TaxID=63459 RepID=UPI000B787C79|nr:uncharacterized protein LOC110738541 [Chenopodium quinoa]